LIHNLHYIPKEGGKNEKNVQKIIISLSTVISMTAALISTQIVLADTKVTSEYVSSKVAEAKEKKSIGVYNEAYSAIIQLPEAQQAAFMSQLATISNDVYTQDVVDAVDAIKKAWNDKTKVVVSDAQSIINNVKNKENKQWLMTQLPSVQGDEAQVPSTITPVVLENYSIQLGGITVPDGSNKIKIKREIAATIPIAMEKKLKI
jgi:hypothetical protein